MTEPFIGGVEARCRILDRLESLKRRRGYVPRQYVSLVRFVDAGTEDLASSLTPKVPGQFLRDE
ncbi:unannotated protein [freshwater metagenome]|uniref:Unannotated protein n=1 Tax=freshwater metagenome TaxID=449393 RepID=A0A6J7LIH2_9ZZZZ